MIYLSGPELNLVVVFSLHSRIVLSLPPVLFTVLATNEDQLLPEVSSFRVHLWRIRWYDVCWQGNMDSCNLDWIIKRLPNRNWRWVVGYRALDKSLGRSDYSVFTCVHVEYVNMKWQLPINLIRWNLIHKLTFGRNFINAVGHDWLRVISRMVCGNYSQESEVPGHVDILGVLNTLWNSGKPQGVGRKDVYMTSYHESGCT